MIQLSSDQIRNAAMFGVKLLSSKKKVRVSGRTAVNGGMTTLFTVLQGIANGSLVVSSAPTRSAAPEEPVKPEPENEVSAEEQVDDEK